MDSTTAHGTAITGSASIGSASRGAATTRAREDHPSCASSNRELGARGEALAAAYLEERGFRILDRNWRNRHGELDLVAQDGNAIAAVEVKTRSGTGYGGPLEAITARKAARLRRLLLDWARAHEVRAPRLRVDAVGIVICPGEEPRIEHLRGIS